MSAPKWLGSLAGLNPKQEKDSEGKTVWTVDVDRKLPPMELGTSGRGGRLKLVNPGVNYPFSLAAPPRSGPIKLELDSVGQKLVTLTGRFTSVALSSGPSQGRADLLIDDATTTLGSACTNLNVRASSGSQGGTLSVEALPTPSGAWRMATERPVGAVLVHTELQRVEIDTPITSALDVTAFGTEVDVRCRRLEKPRIRTEGRLHIRSNDVLDASLSAHTIVIEPDGPNQTTLHGTQDLEASEITIRGGLPGGKARSRIAVSEALRVLGAASHCDITGTATRGVTIGNLRAESTRVDSQPPNPLGTSLRDTIRVPGTSLSDVLVNAHVDVGGDVVVVGNAIESSILSGSDVTIAGNCRLAAPEAEGGPRVAARARSLRIGRSLGGDSAEISVADELHAREISDLSIVGSEEMKMFTERLERVRVSCATLDVSGAATHSKLTVIDSVRVDARCDAASTLTVDGSAVLGDGFDGKVIWSARAGETLQVHGRLADLEVAQGQAHQANDRPAPVLQGIPDLQIGKLAVSTSLVLRSDRESIRVNPMASKRDLQVEGVSIDAMVIDDNCRVELQTSGGRIGVLQARSDFSIEFDQHQYEFDLQAESDTTLASLSGGECLKLVGDPRDSHTRPGVIFDGSRVEIYCNLPTLRVGATAEARSEREPSSDPEVALLRNRTVNRVSGTFKLAELNGSMFAADGDVIAIRQLASTIGDEGVTTKKELLKGEDEAGITGVLVGAYVCELQPFELRRLRRLRVLELDRKALLKFARHRDPGGQQARAQHLRNLADLVTEKSVTGGSRAASRWSAIHAAALALGKGHRFERTWRTIHRHVFGYGYLFRAPLIWLAGWLASLTLALFWLDPGTSVCRELCSGDYSCGDYVDAPYSLWDQAQRVLLMPLHLLRYDGGGAPQYAAPFNSSAASAGISLITALLLGGLILALRNYLRTPTRRNVEEDDIRNV